MLKKKSDRITKIEPTGESNPVRPKRSEDTPLPERRRREDDPKPFVDKLDKAIEQRIKDWREGRK